MEWTFAFRSEGDFLEVIVTGELTVEELGRMSAAALIELKNQKTHKCLINMMDITKAITIFEIYGQPKAVQELGVTRQYRICLLVKEEFKEQSKFAETVYSNNGFDYGSFTNRESAIQFITKR